MATRSWKRSLRWLTAGVTGVGLLMASGGTCAAGEASKLRVDVRRQSFDEGWLFLRGDVSGAQRPDFDDSHWVTQRLPHDWAIGGPFDAKLNPHTGALPISGVGWYRKTFSLPLTARDRLVRVEFDGAMSNARVWLNGVELGARPNGYIGFGFDLTPHLHLGDSSNVLVVRLSPEADSSRWYPGAGLYRHVWLEVTGPQHVNHWGTYVTFPSVSSTAAEISIRTELGNSGNSPRHAHLRTSLIDASGAVIAVKRMPVRLPARGDESVPTTINVSQPTLWDVDQPYLYTLVSEVLVGERVVDRYTTPVGIRSIAFDRKRGLLLNGHALKFQGVCLHHDLGALGAAVNRRATERQLQILKAAGVNAIRTSHNPPSPELLEFADRLGFLVIDEAFDVWRVPKVPNGYNKYFDEWSERDLRDMVRRDRNHPSVVMWSIGNEIPEQSSPTGWQEARRLTRLFHREDPTRPTTSAFDNWQDAIRNRLADEVDIPGFNYAPNQYQQILHEHPGWLIYGSETASCVSSRGVYHVPLQKYEKHPSLQISSYDIIAPPWAYCPDVEFDAQERVPAVLGEFVWTGFDYLGEPTPYFGWEADNGHDWPARSSYFGMVDLAGFPKDRYFLYQSLWTRAPMVHLLPHWNWPDRLGQMIPVVVYSNAEEVELFLNGTSLGTQQPRKTAVTIPVGKKISDTGVFSSKYRLMWQVPYQPGVLRAVARIGGQEVAHDERRTAGVAARVRLQTDRSVIGADGDDLAFITVRVEDAEGNLVPDAGSLIHFEVFGSGRIEAVDNGNAASIEPFHSPTRQAFHGLALLIVRSLVGSSGPIGISATSEGLQRGNITVLSERSDP